jgi:carboxyl-terminal processing protease
VRIREENAPGEFSTFWEAWSFLDENYYGEIPADDERVYGAIRGMVSSFGDQHTAFIDPVRAAVNSENISGSFEGIGASIRLDEAGRLVIAYPFPDRPAFEAGLHPDDVVLEVDGQPIEGLNLYEAVLLIRGPAGSTVTLLIFREGSPEPFEVSIVRTEIEIEVVQSELLEDDIGYVRLTQFSKGAADKMTEAIEALFEQGATRLIFDLRSNPGGLLSEAVNVSSIFLGEGTIVVERLKGDEEKIFEVKRGYQAAAKIPLVVLVNGGSASASEIVAGAIQDYERGQIIGDQTFGKGSVQLPHTLADNSQLRVTVAEWLTPDRRQIHGEGITPDVTVEMSFEDVEQELDPQLDEAIKILSEVGASASRGCSTSRTIMPLCAR